MIFSGCGMNNIEIGADEIAPLVYNLANKTITLTYTDDNTDEDLLIYTDKATYADGLAGATVYFTVLNTTSKTSADISFLFMGNENIKRIEKHKIIQETYYEPEYEKIEIECETSATSTLIEDVCYKYNQIGTTTNIIDKDSWANIEIQDNIELLGAKDHSRKKDGKGAKGDKKITVNLPKYNKKELGAVSNNFILFRAFIEYPINNNNEFFIEVFGKNGSYGHLDPTFGNDGGGTWTHYEELQVAYSKVSATLTNFPVLITEDNISAKMFSTHCLGTGADIRFATSTTGGEIPFEVVKWATTTPDAEIWMKVPSVSHTATTSVYMFCGNGSATAYAASDTYGRNAVWSDYELVAHVQEQGNGTSGEYVDSSGSSNSGTGSPAPDRDTVSKIGKYSQLFDNPTGTNILFPAGLANGWTNFQFSAWFKFPSGETLNDNQCFFSRFISSKPRNWIRALMNVNGTLGFQPAKSNTYYNTTTVKTYDDDLWHYVTFQSIGGSTTANIFVDNDTVVSGTTYSTLALGTPTYGFEVGRNAGGTWEVDGYMQGLRVMNGYKSADWITAEYNNQNSPTTFILEQEITEIGGGETPISSPVRQSEFWY